jgi:hypothetical protein
VELSLEPWQAGTNEETMQNRYLLYSVGPDRLDDLAGKNYPDGKGHGDHVFPLPPAPARSGARPARDPGAAAPAIPANPFNSP